ncbi:hypothetical protein ACFRFU_35580 [Streptomyces sp. NPDC056704]|uniref:Mu transposase domain-containing protein n=1 Tax=Streptomyces sp. NPDC056704 TaxID=3345917 RepID=UPI003692EE0D
MTGGRGTDAVIDAVGMEAHGNPVTKAAQWAAGLLPDALAQPFMEKAGLDRLGALYAAIDLVRRGGTVSLSGVYGGAMAPPYTNGPGECVALGAGDPAAAHRRGPPRRGRFRHPPPASGGGVPEAKGLVERANGYLETSYFPGRTFAGADDFNTQLTAWLAVANRRQHRTLGARPVDRWEADRAQMLALPPVDPPRWWRFATRIARDHYIRVDTCDYSVHPLAIGKNRRSSSSLSPPAGRKSRAIRGAGPSSRPSPTRTMPAPSP